MAQATKSKKRTTRDISQAQWMAFATEFTQLNRGAHARLSVLDGESGYDVGTENRPFEGISIDGKDGENNAWIAFGSAPGEHYTHGIHGLKAIRELPPTSSSGAVLELEG